MIIGITIPYDIHMIIAIIMGAQLIVDIRINF